MEVFDSGFWQFISAEILILAPIFGIIFHKLNKLSERLENLMREHEKENAKWREDMVERMAHVEAKVNGKEKRY